jgi:Fur family ferric uptake transcriptional regulator
MEIYGLCANCLKNRPMVPMPLSKARSGERVIIRSITGGTGSRMRLLTMGLRLGDKVEVITNTNHGQVVIAAEYKRYVLGRGLAEKIQVEPVSG